MAGEEGTSESSMVSSMFRASWSDSCKNSEDVLSSEEVAWIDSCLTTDSDILDSGWDALKDALTEVITLESEPSDNISTAGYDILEMPHSSTEERGFGAERNIDCLFEDDGDSFEEVDSEGVSLKNVFLHKEFPEETGVDDDSKWLDVGEEIFKVWDLEIPDEEDEFEKQLNKALLPAEVEDRDLLDKLVAGIGDMSL